MDTEISVSTESRPWRSGQFSRRSSRDSNPRPFNHESGALTTELSPPECDQNGTYTGARHHATTTTPPPTSARQHSSNKTTPLRPDSSPSSYHNDSKIAIQTTTIIPTLSSSSAWSREQQLTNQPNQKEQEKKGINTQFS